MLNAKNAKSQSRDQYPPSGTFPKRERYWNSEFEKLLSFSLSVLCEYLLMQ